MEVNIVPTACVKCEMSIFSVKLTMDYKFKYQYMENVCTEGYILSVWLTAHIQCRLSIGPFDTPFSRLFCTLDTCSSLCCLLISAFLCWSWISFCWSSLSLSLSWVFSCWTALMCCSSWADFTKSLCWSSAWCVSCSLAISTCDIESIFLTS